jgi:polysaccharide export outer membrane protein
MRNPIVRAVLHGVLAASALVGCSGVCGPYTWIDQYPVPATSTAGYHIGIGDLLVVQVYDNEKMSGRTRVRPDGRITMPLLPELPAADLTPSDLAREIERQLREQKLVVTPRVSISVEESKPLTISVLGKVARPGTFTLEPGAGVAQAIASAGGLTEFAHDDRIFVVRRGPEPVRLRFSMELLTGQSPAAALFRLQSGDLIVAE